MCIAFFVWKHPQAPDLLLLALFNRDEIFERPTAPSHYWEDSQDILGGRDLVAGGTWMCVSKQGRAAFLTNFRELSSVTRMGAPSRGELVAGFVRSCEGPEEYLGNLNAQAFPGFNLLVADLAQQRMAYLCNKGECRLQEVPPGLHGITNGHLDAHWPKVDEGRRQLQSLLDSGGLAITSSTRDAPGLGSAPESGAQANAAACSCAATEAGVAGSDGGGSTLPWRELFQVLSDDRLLEQDPARLPKTGYGPSFEAAASGIFMQPISTAAGLFGTRSQAVLAVWRDGRAELHERYRVSSSGQWREVQHSFHLNLVNPPDKQRKS